MNLRVSGPLGWLARVVMRPAVRRQLRECEGMASAMLSHRHVRHSITLEVLQQRLRYLLTLDDAGVLQAAEQLRMEDLLVVSVELDRRRTAETGGELEERDPSLSEEYTAEAAERIRARAGGGL